jgi:hypothetical protein
MQPTLNNLFKNRAFIYFIYYSYVESPFNPYNFNIFETQNENHFFRNHEDK